MESRSKLGVAPVPIGAYVAGKFDVTTWRDARHGSRRGFLIARVDAVAPDSQRGCSAVRKTVAAGGENAGCSERTRATQSRVSSRDGGARMVPPSARLVSTQKCEAAAQNFASTCMTATGIEVLVSPAAPCTPRESIGSASRGGVPRCTRSALRLFTNPQCLQTKARLR